MEGSLAKACQVVAWRITHLSGQITWDRKTSAGVFKLDQNVCPVLLFVSFEAEQQFGFFFFFVATQHC